MLFLEGNNKENTDKKNLFFILKRITKRVIDSIKEIPPIPIIVRGLESLSGALIVGLYNFFLEWDSREKNIEKLQKVLLLLYVIGFFKIHGEDIKNFKDFYNDPGSYEVKMNLGADFTAIPKKNTYTGKVKTLYEIETINPLDSVEQQKKIKDIINKIQEKVKHEWLGRSSTELVFGLYDQDFLRNGKDISIEGIRGKSSDERIGDNGVDNTGIGEYNKENDSLALARAKQFYKELEKTIKKESAFNNISVDNVKITGQEDILNSNECDSIIFEAKSNYPTLSQTQAVIKYIRKYNRGKQKSKLLDNLLKEKRSVIVSFSYMAGVNGGNAKIYQFPTMAMTLELIPLLILIALLNYISNNHKSKNIDKKDNKGITTK